MEGPTPVSALIHAATMVTAGVYLIVRCHPLFENAYVIQDLAAGLGAATLLMAGLIALVQTDIKRVIAYSTMSQIGYMFVGAGLGAYPNAMFHLMTHAFFKALLFLAAGIAIHAIAGEQDIRKLAGIGKLMPQTKIVFLIGSLALVGIPPFAGFFSKDSILASALARGWYGDVIYRRGHDRRVPDRASTPSASSSSSSPASRQRSRVSTSTAITDEKGPLSMRWTVGDARRLSRASAASCSSRRCGIPLSTWLGPVAGPLAEPTSTAGVRLLGSRDRDRPRRDLRRLDDLRRQAGRSATGAQAARAEVLLGRGSTTRSGTAARTCSPAGSMHSSNGR